MNDDQFEKMINNVHDLDAKLNRALGALMKKSKPDSLTECQLDEVLAMLDAHRIPVRSMRKDWADALEAYSS